jgi:glycosyltransferase involved in cell wall biosynthesis
MSRGILLLGNYPPPYGGVPRYIENLAPFLVSRGWQVHVLSIGHSGVERHQGFTVHKLPWSRKAALLLRHGPGRPRSPIGMGLAARGYPSDWVWFNVAYAVGREILRTERIDVLCGFNLYRGALVGALLSHATGVPLVVNNFGELFSHGGFFEANPGVLPFIHAQARRFVSGSRHCASGYARFGLHPSVEVVPYGVDSNRFRPDRDGAAMRRRVGIEAATPVVLFVGRFVRDMGLHVVLDAVPAVLKRRPDARFLLVGAVGELSAAAAEVAARVGGKVIIRQNVPFDELPDWYAAGDLVVAPTTGDRACSSLAAAEALATARPVIATDVGGIPEVVTDGATGCLIPPENHSALADRIVDLLERAELRHEMGARGRAWIEANWDTRHVLGRMESVFAGAAGDAA